MANKFLNDTGLTTLWTKVDDKFVRKDAFNTALSGKSDVGHTHSYLPLSGGTINGTTNSPLVINTSYTVENGIKFQMNNESKLWLGYTPNIGGYLYSYGAGTGTHKLGLTDDGKGFLDSYTLIHSGNIGDQSVNYATTAGYADSTGSVAWSNVTGKPSVAIQQTANDFVYASNEWTVVPSGYSGTLWLNYRTTGGTDGNITEYSFGNGAGVCLATISNGQFSGNAATATYATTAGSAPASDVYAWAKAASKPSYKTSEVTEETNLYFTNQRAINACSGTYLPLSGGTLSNSTSDTSLYVKGDAVGSWIGFQNRNSPSITFGYLGVKSDNQPYFYSETSYKILHTGNYFDYAYPSEEVTETQTSDDWIHSYALTDGKLRSNVYNTFGVEWNYLIGISSGKRYGTILRTTYGNGNNNPRLQLKGLYQGSWSNWREVSYSGHTHTKSEITDFPTYTFTDANPTLSWGTKSKIATVGGTDIHVTMPANPNSWPTLDDLKGVPINRSNCVYTNVACRYMGGTSPGYYRIVFPDSAKSIWNMVDMEIFVRQNHNSGWSGKILIYTHNDCSNVWKQLNATIIGNLTSDIKVYAAEGKYIYIAGCSAWGTINIDKILIGDDAVNKDLSGITIDYVSELPSTYQTAIMRRYSLDGHTHNSVSDSNNSTATTFAYSKSGLNYSDYTWLAGWNGYELRTVDKSHFAQATHTHTSFSNNLTVSGTITATGFYEVSDERLKDFEDDIDIDLNALKKIPKKYFKFKEDPTTTHIGTSAQVIKELYPELVTENEEGHLSVDYAKLSVIALKAIDEIRNETDDKIKSLENKIDYLEQLIKSK